MRAGVALKPGTDTTGVRRIAHLVDMVLIMTVEPGFGGQSFMEEPLAKVRELRAAFPALDIEVDGGLSGAQHRSLCGTWMCNCAQRKRFRRPRMPGRTALLRATPSSRAPMRVRPFVRCAMRWIVRARSVWPQSEYRMLLGRSRRCGGGRCRLGCIRRWQGDVCAATVRGLAARATNVALLHCATRRARHLRGV